MSVPVAGSIEIPPRACEVVSCVPEDFPLLPPEDEVSESLLSVTDARAAASERPTIIKAYRSVRGNAAKHVTAALPAVGALVQKYAG